MPRSLTTFAMSRPVAALASSIQLKAEFCSWFILKSTWVTCTGAGQKGWGRLVKGLQLIGLDVGHCTQVQGKVRLAGWRWFLQLVGFEVDLSTVQDKRVLAGWHRALRLVGVDSTRVDQALSRVLVPLYLERRVGGDADEVDRLEEALHRGLAEGRCVLPSRAPVDSNQFRHVLTA